MGITNCFWIRFEACSTTKSKPGQKVCKKLQSHGTYGKNLLLLAKQHIANLLSKYIWLYSVFSLCNGQQLMQSHEGQKFWEWVSIECSALNRTSIATSILPRPREHYRERWNDNKSQKIGRSAMKCCLWDMTLSLQPCTHGSYDYLHKIKSTWSVNILIDSTNWTRCIN